MRLMLGYGNTPTLLVEVLYEPYDPKEFMFEFIVVNGLWKGKFIDGDIHMPKNRHDWQSRVYELHPENPNNPIEILSDNQDRLRGNYSDVFLNWDNPDYVAPINKTIESNSYWDSDIPF